MDPERKVVLVVEDDNSLRTILTDRLSNSNFQVVAAEDGQKAVELIDQHKPHLILLDLLLPKLDGFQVLEYLRNHPDPSIANTRVIILSNLWSDKDILRAKSLRIDDYYVKSMTNLGDIYIKVQQALGAAGAP